MTVEAPDNYAFSDCFDGVWMHHPKKSDRILAGQAAVKHLTQQSNRDTFGLHHAMWC